MGENSVALQNSTIRRRRGVGAKLTALLLMALILGTLPAGQLMARRAQPEALALAAQQPARMVQVLVQTARNADLQSVIEQLGGVVTQDFAFISTVAATIPARAISALSTAHDVVWV